MLKIGDKVKCVSEQSKSYISLGQILYVSKIDYMDDELDILLKGLDGRTEQWANSERFVKVEE